MTTPPEMSQPPISVILATRDRPALFAAALKSVLMQRLQGFEVIVVDDGSSQEARAEYHPLLEDARSRMGERFQVFHLVHRPNGHGQSYSLNYGVSKARGAYVTFLDDDDEWTDPEHLARALACLGRNCGNGEPPELYMANQQAFRGETPVAGTVWLEGLGPELEARGRTPRDDGSFEVTLDELMQASGFCHLNCFVIRKALYDAVGGMDEGVRWECDRDIYLRLVDAAGCMLHHPAVVSRHNVPDPKKQSSMTTSLNQIQRRLFQVRVLDKAALFARNAVVRRHGRRHKAYAVKKIAQDLAAAGRWADARNYAAQGLGAGPGLKWLGFTAYCALRSLAARE